MSLRHRIQVIFIPVLTVTIIVAGLFGVLQQRTTLAAPLAEQPDPAEIFNHLDGENRLHWTVSAITLTTGAYVAPDGDWNGGAGVSDGISDTITQAIALRMPSVAIFRTSVQDKLGQDIAWEATDLFDKLDTDWNQSLSYTVLTDTQITTATLADFDILLLPSYINGFSDQVIDALGDDGLTALDAFVHDGGTVYAQGQASYLLEAAGTVPTGTVDLDTPLSLPFEADNLGLLQLNDSMNPLGFNWETNELWLLDDPMLTVTPPLTAVSSYTNTTSGTQPAVVYGRFGDGQLILVSGHATSGLHRDQQTLFLNTLLMSSAEKGELHGRAIQTYDSNVAANLIPAYEDNIPISVTLHYDNLWQGISLTNSIITERVQVGFEVITTSITPPADVDIIVTDGVTETIIVWDVGDAPFGSQTFQYTATTDLDSLASGYVIFSQGEVTYSDDGQAASWAHPDFILLSAMPARMVGEHDNEPDRYFTIPEDGLYIDEFIYLENKEVDSAYNVSAMRYIPIIVPIVGLEDQREPLTTNAGETVWMKNMLFTYDDGRYPLPVGMSGYTETWGLDAWDGVTFVTMTTPGGYHIDPLPLHSPSPGFFVTIPPAYSHMITVTAVFELLLPAMKVEWMVADEFPGYHYEMPAIRYGIHSTELFSRPVSFTGDPFVETVVVDATGGSIYTGLGNDPRIDYREHLADVEIHPPTPPITIGLTYQDVWSRTHEIPIRANFVDVFNFASCGGCGGNSERHAMLNVTFGIWVDMDGDGDKDTLLTDLDEMKGVMPTRLTGDLVILIKSRNLGTKIGADENVIDGRIFRGLGYSITPSNTTWFDSYESIHSTLITETRDGGYDQLIFQQDIPINATDLITINAKFDPTANNVEGMLKLHDGVRFIYRQQFAGPGQYEVSDTHVQSIIGERTDMELDSRVMPATVSTYGDNLFVRYEIGDDKDWVTFDMDPYMESWGYGRLAATTYVGGRDKMELLHSIVSLGDRTWLRVEINNNDGDTLTGVELFPDVPEGIVATAVFTDLNNLPMPMWPDLPFLHLEDIPDTAYGIYYFELEISEEMTELQGQVLEIPFIFGANNAPEGFEIPPAKLAIRHADGHVPSFISGAATDMLLHDMPEPTMDVLDMRLLTDDEADTLRQLVVSDATIIPNTHEAETYFNNIRTTVPYEFDGEIGLSVNLPTTLPWLPDDESAINLIAYEFITTTRAVRQPINDETNIEGLDSFEQIITDTTPTLYVDARGASVQTTIITETIIGGGGGEGEGVSRLYAYEWYEVVLEITTGNSGNDVAVDTVITVTLGDNFTPTVYPTNVVPFDGGLRIYLGDLAPGVSRTVKVTFDVYAEPEKPKTKSPAIWMGQITAVSQSDGEFINAYSGNEVNARTGGAFIMPIESRTPIGWRVFLPTIMNNVVTAPDLVVTAVAVTPNQATITIKNQGDATANVNCVVNDTCFWVDMYIAPNPVPTQVNEIWNNVAPSGAAWEITDPLAPGEELTLALNGAYYSDNRSSPSLPFAIGAQAYVQVDSFNLDTTHGTVNENHEISGNAYNNIMGPVTITQE